MARILPLFNDISANYGFMTKIPYGFVTFRGICLLTIVKGCSDKIIRKKKG